MLDVINCADLGIGIIQLFAIPGVRHEIQRLERVGKIREVDSEIDRSRGESVSAATGAAMMEIVNGVEVDGAAEPD